VTTGYCDVTSPYVQNRMKYFFRNHPAPAIGLRRRSKVPRQYAHSTRVGFFSISLEIVRHQFRLTIRHGGRLRLALGSFLSVCPLVCLEIRTLNAAYVVNRGVRMFKITVRSSPPHSPSEDRNSSAHSEECFTRRRENYETKTIILLPVTLPTADRFLGDRL